MGTFTKLVIGLGTLKINSVDVGFLKGNVSAEFSTDKQIFESGIPLTEQGLVIVRQRLILSASLAEFSSANFSLVNGGIPVVDGGTYNRIRLGKAFTLNYYPVEFTWTSPITGKYMKVYMYKSVIEGGGIIKFGEETFSLQDITIRSLHDSTHADDPLGYIDFEK